MEPAVKPAALLSKTGNIGILATKGTLEGRLFKETSQKYAGGINVHVQVGEGLVEKVELGEEASMETICLLTKYIQPMIDKNIDHLVLGCTHYPFLSDSIEKITKRKIKLIDPANAVAIQTKRLLTENNMLNSERNHFNHTFYNNGGNKDVLLNILAKEKIANVEIVNL